MAKIGSRFFDWIRKTQEYRQRRDKSEAEFKSTADRINQNYTEEIIKIMDECFAKLKEIGTSGPLAEAVTQECERKTNIATMLCEEELEQARKDYEGKTMLILDEYRHS